MHQGSTMMVLKSFTVMVLKQFKRGSTKEKFHNDGTKKVSQ